MNKLIITSFVLLFLFPSVSYSTTFKCEFITEKFKGGKSNRGDCSGDPEIVFGTTESPWPRNKHCRDMTNYMSFDYNYLVDLDKKTISYTSTIFGKKYKKFFKSPVILSIHPIIQIITRDKEPDKWEKTTSYLVTYKDTFHINIYHDERVYTLYIPHYGKSIISEYYADSNNKADDASSVKMQFGKCVNISN